MAKCKVVESHQFNEGDTVYILGKYGYGWEYPLCVVEAKIAYQERKRWYAYGVHDNTTWSFPASYYNYSVFTDKEKAIERMNAENDFRSGKTSNIRDLPGLR